MDQHLLLTDLPQEILVMIVKELYTDTNIKTVKQMSILFDLRSYAQWTLSRPRSFSYIMLANKTLSRIAADIFPQFATVFISESSMEWIVHHYSLLLTIHARSLTKFQHIVTDLYSAWTLVEKGRNRRFSLFPKLGTLIVQDNGESF